MKMYTRAEPEIIKVQTLPMDSNQSRVIIGTSVGEVEGIYHYIRGNRGVIWVCGALGGFEGPSFGIFQALSQELLREGISSLRLTYRHPGDFDQCVLDVLVGIRFLQQKEIFKIALVGHSFGGAVVIMAGTISPLVNTVVGLSSQTFGAHRVNELSPRPLLLVHGERDRNLSARCSREIYDSAKEPKELVIYNGCGHFLRECHQELHDLLTGWLVGKLGRSVTSKT